MTGARVTLLASQELRLRQFLEADPHGHERAAIVLFHRIEDSVRGLDESDRYLAVEVIPFRDEWVTSSSPSHIAFELRGLRELFRRCEEEKLVLGFVHNHPTGFACFSDVDEQNEQTLLRALSNRNGPDVHLVSLLWTSGRWLARVRHPSEPFPRDVRHLMVPDWPLRLYGLVGEEGDAAQSRQAAAFGQPFVDKLGSLRIGIVGAGGTGSPTITLLARSGVKELVVVDNDSLERSNLNRVRGARVSDVNRNKADIIADFINSLGLGTHVAPFQSLVDQDPVAVDAISTCDLVFGCTDDQIGRELLSAASYAYAMPYIDMGLGGQISTDSAGEAILRYHYGRVSTILPEQGECLFCQGVINDQSIRREYALRDNPDLTEAEAVERYLEGGAEQAPGIGPFTSATADYAVASLFDLIRPFRRFPAELRRDSFKVDFVKMEIRSAAPRGNASCPYCGTRDYLLMSSKYRLNRPSLGIRDAST